MSGEAGATISGTHYGIFVGTGLIVSVAMRPGGDGGDVGRYFASKSRPYEELLANARPALDELFAEEAERLRLAPIASAKDYVDGVIIADDPATERMNAAHFRKHHHGGPIVLTIDDSNQLPNRRSLRISIAVTERITRAAMSALAARVAAALTPHLGDLATRG